MHLHADIDNSSRFLRVLPLSVEEVDDVEDADVFNLDVLFREFISPSINE
jgi:hypothetical protein